METLHFSNSSIDLACEEVGNFLSKAGVDRREALRIKLTFEAVLLEYQDRFGVDATYRLKCIDRLSAIRIEIEVSGEQFNPLELENDDRALINGLLAGIGLAPSYIYKNGKNYTVFTPKKKPMSGTVKMLVAIALSVISGLLLTLLPDEARSNLSEHLLTPVTDLFFQLIFIAIMVGLPMLVLSTRVNRVFELVEQLSTLVRTIMSTLSSMLPGLIFLIFTGMISSGNLSTILNSWNTKFCR